MNNASFALRRLPDKARFHVIKSLDYVQLVSFSFISTKSKLLVKSFSVPMDFLEVTFDGQLSISLFPPGRREIQFNLYENQEMGEPPKHLNVVSDRITIDWQECWKNLGLSFNAIFQHLLSLFRVGKITLTIDNETEDLDTADFRSLISEWSWIKIVNASDTYVQKLSDTLIPLTKYVFLEMPEFAEEIFQVFPQKLGIQNLDYLNLDSKYRLTLDDALAMNSRRFRIHQLSTKETNRFFKSWIKGSNPRMKESYVVLKEEEVNQEMLLKGLKCQVMPEELERRVNECNVIIGGFDVRNKLGKLATIKIRANTVDFIVWD